jgi:hypothetical protein
MLWSNFSRRAKGPPPPTNHSRTLCMAGCRLILRHVSGLRSINFNLNADLSYDCPRGLMSTSATQRGYTRPEAEKHQTNLFPKLSPLCICAGTLEDALLGLIRPETALEALFILVIICKRILTGVRHICIHFADTHMWKVPDFLAVELSSSLSLTFLVTR